MDNTDFLLVEKLMNWAFIPLVWNLDGVREWRRACLWRCFWPAPVGVTDTVELGGHPAAYTAPAAPVACVGLTTAQVEKLATALADKIAEKWEEQLKTAIEEKVQALLAEAKSNVVAAETRAEVAEIRAEAAEQTAKEAEESAEKAYQALKRSVRS